MHVHMFPEPGTFEFSKPSLLFKESAGRALIPIERTNGCDGKAVVTYKTEDMTAKAGQDYEAGAGELVFEHGELSKTLEIVIYDDKVSPTTVIRSNFGEKDIKKFNVKFMGIYAQVLSRCVDTTVFMGSLC